MLPTVHSIFCFVSMFAATDSVLLALPQDAPQEGAPFTRVIAHPSGARLMVDISEQRLALDVPIERDYGNARGRTEEVIHPRLSGHLSEHQRFVSASELGMKAKRIDDGLLAAIEVAGQRGAGEFPAKMKLLAEWARSALSEDPAANEAGLWNLLAAQAEGAAPLDLKEPALSARTSARQRFLADEKRSKPLGFYTWNAELEGIFRQDRLLQELLTEADWQSVMAALRANPQLFDAYRKWLELARGVTNDFAGMDLARVLDGAEMPSEGAAILPASRSFEGDLMKRLYGSQSIPEGFDLATTLIAGVQSGSLSLAPRANSGWYDYQAFALEPLASPERTAEAARLVYSKRYRAELALLLKGLLALTRETHVKQLEIPTPGAAIGRISVTLYPELRVEPLPTHYWRRAQAYAYLAQHLQRCFGTAGLQASFGQRESGPSTLSLWDELAWVEQLFRGAALCSCEDLGLAPGQIDEALVADPMAMDVFTKWSQSRRSDPDLDADVRMMVPVYYDVERMQTKVWVLLGWSRKSLDVSFSQRPKVAVDAQGNASRDDLNVTFENSSYDLHFPVSAERYVNRLLNRDEWRALCDRHRTQKDILDALDRLN